MNSKKNYSQNSDPKVIVIFPAKNEEGTIEKAIAKKRKILNRLINLIKNGEITVRISGRDLMALFRILGMNVKVNTTIKIEDHGKLLSFSDKLKEDYGDTINDS